MSSRKLGEGFFCLGLCAKGLIILLSKSNEESYYYISAYQGASVYLTGVRTLESSRSVKAAGGADGTPRYVACPRIRWRSANFAEHARLCVALCV